jgi:hypothetical protein
MGYNSTTELVANTEREILASAFDLEPEDLPGHIDDEADNDLEQLEGWDGEPLSDEEGFESAVNGHSESGIDRPLALSEGERYEAELEAMRQQNAAMATNSQPPIRISLRSIRTIRTPAIWCSRSIARTIPAKRSWSGTR